MSIKRLVPLNTVSLTADPSNAVAGDIYYNSTSSQLRYFNGTSWVILAGSVNALVDAKSIYQDVRNQSGTSMAVATPVYVSGSLGASNKILISTASNASEATSSKTMGITTSSISDNSNGQVISEGLLEGIDTTGAADGDPVWLGVNGAKIYGLLNKPSAPAHLVFLGIVVRGGSATTGSMYVKIQNGFELQEIHNVEISSLINGNILAYDSTTQTWKNTNTLQSTASTIPLVVKASASQTANLQEWQDSTGTMLSNIGPTGSLRVPYIGSTTANLTYITTNFDTNSIGITPYSANQKGLVIRSAASQTANLQEWQTSAGVNIAYLSAAGSFSTASGNILLNSNGRAALSMTGATSIGLTIRGAVAHTGDLQQWWNNSQSILSGVNAAGYHYIGATSVNATTNFSITVASFTSTTATYNYANAVQPFIPGETVTITGFAPTGYNGTFQIQSIGGTSGAYTFTVANTTNTAVTTNTGTAKRNAQLSITSPNIYSTPLVIRADASQSSNLTEWQNSAGSNIALISGTGNMNVNGNMGVGGTVNTGSVWESSQNGPRLTLSANSANVLNAAPILARATGANQLPFATRAASPTLTITNAVANGTTIVYTANSTSYVSPGNVITVTGVVSTGNPSATAGSGFNVTNATVTSATSTTITVTVALTDTYTSGGSIAVTSTADLQQWQNAAGTALARIISTGGATFTGNTVLSGGVSVSGNYGGNNTMTITNSQNIIGLNITGTSGQTANLQQWNNSGGTTIAKVDKDGNITANSFVKTSGTSSQFLKADGSVDSSTYLTNNYVTLGNTLLEGVSGQTYGLIGTSAYLDVKDTNGYNKEIELDITAVEAQLVTDGFAKLASPTFTGTVTVPTLIVSGDFTVNGTTTNINTTNLIVEDKNITIADVATPTDTTANGAGITIKGTTDKTFNWVQSTGRFTSSEPIQSPGLVVSTPTNTTNAGVFYNSAGTIVFNVDTSLNQINIGGGLSGVPNNFASAWGYDSALNAGFMTFQTGALGSDSFAIRRTNHVASGDYTVSALGNLRFSTASGKNFNFNNGSVGIATTAIGTNNKLIVNPYSTVDNLATVQINTNSATNKGLVIQGYDSQTANLTEWQNSAGVVTAYIGNSISYFGSVLTVSNDIKATYGIHGGGLTTAFSAMGTQSWSPTMIAMLVKGTVSQTADLQQWQNSDGTSLAKINNYGDVTAAGLFTTGGIRGGTLTSFGAQHSFATATGATTTPSVAIRAIASQTANLTEWQDSAGNVLSSISSSGSINLSAGKLVSFSNGTVQKISLGYGGNYSIGVDDYTTVITADNNASNGRVGIRPHNATYGTSYVSPIELYTNGQIKQNLTIASNVGLIIKGAASQTANLTEWQNSAGTVLASVTQDGDAKFRLVYVGTTTNYGAMFNVNTFAAANIGIIIQGVSSQTGDLQQWRNSSGTVLAKVDANGNFSAISKSFDIPHPTKENMRLRYASLEGNEHGVYVRGTTKDKVIELPDYWLNLIDENSITVHLTPIGKPAKIYVKKIEGNKVYLGGRLKEAAYIIHAERKDIDKLTVEY